MRQRGAMSQRQQGEAIVQAAGENVDAERPDLCRRQFQCERHAVEPAADFAYHGRVGVRDLEITDRGACAFIEQFHSRIRQRFGGGDAIAVRWRLQGFQPMAPLAFRPQRNTAGGKDAHMRCRLQDRLRRPGGAVDDMLAVVDHDQSPLVAQRCRQPRQRSGAADVVVRPIAAPTALATRLDAGNDASGTNQVPSGYAPATASATASAMVVLPMPPVPTMVRRTRAVTSAPPVWQSRARARSRSGRRRGQMARRRRFAWLRGRTVLGAGDGRDEDVATARNVGNETIGALAAAEQLAKRADVDPHGRFIDGR